MGEAVPHRPLPRKSAAGQTGQLSGLTLPAMQHIALTPIADFAALGRRWQALEAAADGGFFRSWVFLGCMAETRFAGAHVLSVEQDGQDVALGLLGRRSGRLWLNETGDRVADSVFIEHNGLLVQRGHEDVVGPALRHAARHCPVVLSGVDQATCRALSDDLWLERQQTRFAPGVDVSALAGPFLATLSANTRGQMRRAMRVYGPDLALSRAETTKTALQWFREMVGLHQAAWRRRGKPGAFAERGIADFHEALIARAWPVGGVDVLRVAAGGRHVGTLYQFLHGERVLCYQSGFAYDSPDAREKPGLVCHALAIQFYADLGIRFYDMLAGADRYKLSLARQGEELHWAVLHKPLSMGGILAAAKRVARRG